jgi:hypothetical protein
MHAFEVSTESSYYYYYHNGELTQPLILRLTLDHPVDHGAAQSALARAARTYPQLSSRLAYADGRFCYVENEPPVALYGAGDEACVLGSAATNHYQHRVWAEGPTLAVAANHGLADGRFLWRFMATLLYCYGVERGLVEEGGALRASRPRATWPCRRSTRTCATQTPSGRQPARRTSGRSSRCP